MTSRPRCSRARRACSDSTVMTSPGLIFFAASSAEQELQLQAPSAWQTLGQYTVEGVWHIWLGFDHLLFVLSLLLLVRGWGRLVKTVTAFTLAHSITLTAATLGVARIPGGPVEAVIALSIVLVAVEILREERGQPGQREHGRPVGRGTIRILVHFHEDGIDAERHGGTREGLHVLPLPSRPGSLPAGKLHRVRRIEDHRHAEPTHHPEAPEVDDEVVVAERGPPLGQQDVLAPFTP